MGRPRKGSIAVGDRFTRYVALEEVGARGHNIIWLCRCDCGEEREVNRSNLLSGNSRSCGCLSDDVAADRLTTHGGTYLPEYHVYKGMVRRCHEPGFRKSEYYLGRGITVCDRWRESFAAFYADMGPRPSKRHELDRIDNDGNYEPGNVRWATKEQNRRNTATRRRISFNGESLMMVEWSERTGISIRKLIDRLGKLRWSTERALTTP